MKLFRFVSLIAMLAFSALASAHEYQLGSLHLIHPYAFATVPGQPVGGAYLTIENHGPADRLLAASAEVSQSVELHSMSMEGDVMKMRRLDGIAIPKDGTVELKRGALHIMLVGLKAPFKAGESFPMTLKFEKAGDIKVDVKIEAVGADMGAMKH